jgi:SAM-dependent methyltransferase
MNCPCCLSPSFVAKYYFSYGAIKECTECGSAWVESAGVEVPDFNAEFSTATWIRNRRYEYPFLMRQAISRLRILERHMARGTLLEVGPGEGVFVEAASNAGWKAAGLDRYCKPQAFGSGKRPFVVIGDAQRPPFLQVFDAVTGFHVLEHIEDLDAFLDGLLSVMAWKGFVCFEVPNYGSAQRHLMQSRWSNFYPYHKTHFTRKGIVKLLERKGLRVCLCRSVGDSWEIFGKYYHHARNLVWGPIKRVAALCRRSPAAFGVGAGKPPREPSSGRIMLYGLEGRFMRMVAAFLFGLPVWILNLVGQGPNLVVVAERVAEADDKRPAGRKGSIDGEA